MENEQVQDGPTIQTFLKRVRLRNYKSIGKCDVALCPLTMLVGRNGSGKSNFLDALRFVVDSLDSSIAHAIKARGGIEAVRRRSTGHPRNFAIELEFLIPDDRYSVTYGFEVVARSQGGFAIKQEKIVVIDARGNRVGYYNVVEGIIEGSSIENPPQAVSDRLYLVALSGLDPFRKAYNSLTSMGFYNLNPEVMKELQSPDSGELLHRDGGNIASVLSRLSHSHPKIVNRVRDYLARIVPGITDFQLINLGPKETLLFRQAVEGASHPWKFYAESMSDGTLRALGILVAVTQLADRSLPIRLVGIEEPETALHPAASGALIGAISESVEHTQVLVTTHSPELIDQLHDKYDEILVVNAHRGTTHISKMDEASRNAIKNHLYTAGELLRMNQLEPDKNDIERQMQMTLFGSSDWEK